MEFTQRVPMLDERFERGRARDANKIDFTNGRNPEVVI